MPRNVYSATPHDPIDEEDRLLDDPSDGIDWDEITATTQPDWEAGRFAFNSADYATYEEARAAMTEIIHAIGRKVRQARSADSLDAASS